MQPSPTLGGDRGTKAAEYPRKNVCEENELLGLCRPGLPSGEAVDLSRLLKASSHAGKPSVGAQVECALSQSRECQ
jgi:hypothetical protein